MKTLILILLTLLLSQSVETRNSISIDLDEVIEHIEIKENVQEYVEFKEHLGFLESSSRYHEVNNFGMMGKYQFGKDALKDVHITGQYEVFLSSQSLQEIALYKYLNKNEEYLKDEIEEFVGKEIAGVTITRVGLLAAAHFAGHGGVKRLLYSGYNRTDANDRTAMDYLKEFSNYEFELNEHIEQYVQSTYT